VLPTVLTQSAYSRDMESEADLFAAEAMRRACLAPAALARLLERLEKNAARGSALPQWLSSHPGTSARADALRAVTPRAGCVSAVP